MNKIHNIKEALIAAAIIVPVACLVSFFTLKYDLFRGVRQIVHGFDMYDLYNTEKNRNDLARDTNIILVQIEDEREKIADQINIIRTNKPAIIGIDAVFENKKDSLGDLKFLQSIKNANNIVFATRLGIENHSLTYNFFETVDHRDGSGYVNFIEDHYSVIRAYNPFLKFNGVEEFAFTSRVAQLFSPGKFDKLKRRDHREEIINYTGNTPLRYTSLTKEELIEYDRTGQLSEKFKNKIILLGYFIKYPPLAPDDLHFTPLNGQFGKESFPDMYGVVIHANILSMILDGNYAEPASNTISYLCAVLITFLFLLYIIDLHSEKSYPAYSKILLIQFLLILFVLYFFLQVYILSSWKVPLLPTLISLILCIELLGIYKVIARRLHKKAGYKTVFTYK